MYFRYVLYVMYIYVCLIRNIYIRTHTQQIPSGKFLMTAIARSFGHSAQSIRQHTSAYVSIRQHSYCTKLRTFCTEHTSAYVSIRQHTSAYASIRQHTSAYASIRQHTPAYVSIRQHTSAYVSIR
jgi:hypothetical protein